MNLPKFTLTFNDDLSQDAFENFVEKISAFVDNNLTDEWIGDADYGDYPAEDNTENENRV